MIKLDIVNAVVTSTNISRTKAEQAVETVFESLKNALGRGQRASAGTREQGKKSIFRREKRCGSSPAKNCRAWKTQQAEASVLFGE